MKKFFYNISIKQALTISNKSTVGDASPEARDHGMSVSLNLADVRFLDDSFTFIDCPGSIEFPHEGTLALTACDAAVVVCEPDAKRVPALQLILKQLEDHAIPHFLFLNKIDASDDRGPMRYLQGSGAIAGLEKASWLDDSLVESSQHHQNAFKAWQHRRSDTGLADSGHAEGGIRATAT